MGVNIVALVVAALASMVVGWLWYSPVLFGKTWMRLAKIKKGKDNSGMATGVLFGLI